MLTVAHHSTDSLDDHQLFEYGQSLDNGAACS
jgi:hypothetical protein